MICDGIPDEKLALTNGCGSSYWLVWIFRIPKWVSKEFWCACNIHDIMYQEGTTISDKTYADNLLLDAMYKSIDYDRIYIRGLLKSTLAYIVAFCLSTRLSMSCFKAAKPEKFYFK